MSWSATCTQYARGLPVKITRRLARSVCEVVFHLRIHVLTGRRAYRGTVLYISVHASIQGPLNVHVIPDTATSLHDAGSEIPLPPSSSPVSRRRAYRAKRPHSIRPSCITTTDLAEESLPQYNLEEPEPLHRRRMTIIRPKSHLTPKSKVPIPGRTTAVNAGVP
jgi:hypothetical protein